MIKLLDIFCRRGLSLFRNLDENVTEAQGLEPHIYAIFLERSPSRSTIVSTEIFQDHDPKGRLNCEAILSASDSETGIGVWASLFRAVCYNLVQPWLRSHAPSLVILASPLIKTYSYLKIRGEQVCHLLQSELPIRVHHICNSRDPLYSAFASLHVFCCTAKAHRSVYVNSCVSWPEKGNFK